MGLAGAALAASAVGAGGLDVRNARAFDPAGLAAGAGPLARWDALWFLDIAREGYRGGPEAAFFPLFALLERGLGELAGASPAALLVSGQAVSLAALLGALVLLHRLAEHELGPRLARRAVVLTAVFPGSVFLGAPYSESLFLLLSVGAFLAAREGRWAVAGLAGAGAAATRSAGVLLLVGLVLILLYGPRADRPASERLGAGLRPRHRPGAEAAWLALVPLGPAAYAAWLGLSTGEPLAFFAAQEAWSREFAGPFVGAWEGLVAAFEGARTLIEGPPPAPLGPQGGPGRAAAMQLVLLGFLAFAVVATAGALRRLPAAYGGWTLVALSLPLSYPVPSQPLMSLPRFLAVLFPLFFWLALACERRRVTGPVVAVSLLLFALFAVELGAWHFVA